MPRFRPAAFCLATFAILILSAFSFAAPPDRIAGPINVSSMVSLGSGARPYLWAQHDEGPIEGSFALHNLAFVIKPSASQQKAIDKLLAQQQDPHSAYYHQWLTPEQYGDRFGLSPNDSKKITAWLQSQGFTDIAVARGANLITFSGTAAQAESTFQTQIHRSQADGATQFFNVSPPRIPAALSGIVMGMRGLNNFHLKPANIRMRHNYYDSTTGSQLLAPADIATIYGISSGMDGSGQTLAIIGETDILEADLSDFRTGFSLPPITGCTSSMQAPGVITACDISSFKYVLYLPTGGTDPLVPDSVSSGDLAEADLDIEWSGSTAPSAQVIYVNAPDPNGNGVVDSMQYAISQNIAPVVSMSYDLCELGVASNLASGFAEFAEGEFQQANLQGMTILNSAGDAGAAACDGETGNNPAIYGYSVNYPASSPEVTGVGGTLIPVIAPNEYGSPYWNTTGTVGGSALEYIPEQTWNDDEEFGLFCTANPTNGFCTGNGITDWASAQATFGYISGGGGVSNCATFNAITGECLTGYAQPSYQSKLDASKVNPGGIGELVAATPTRYVPDVSLLASPDFPGYIFCTPDAELVLPLQDPQNIYNNDFNSACQNGIAAGIAGAGSISNPNTFLPPSIVGGTSVSSPSFAGIVALINQAVIAHGIQSKPGLGNINLMLYTLAATATNGAFNPVDTPSTGAYSNGAFCVEGDPTFEPVALQCPSSGTNAGFLGFYANNSDPTTGYNLTTGLGSVNASKLVAAWVATAVASTSTTLISSENPSNFGDSVTFTATVTTTGSSAPTGTVNFDDGTTQIGSGALSTVSGSQVATFTTSSLNPGTHSITAIYQGDSSNASSTSNIVSQVVNAPTFNLSAPSQPGMVLSGQSTTSTFTVTATGAGVTTFAGNVTFACNGLPDVTVKCAFATPTGATQIAAGTQSPVTMTLTISTTGPNPQGGVRKAVRRRADNRLPLLPMTLPLAGVVMVGFAGRKRSKYFLAGSLCVSLALLGLLLACGGSSTPPVGITVSPEGATLFPNDAADNWPPQTASFTATVTNTSNTAVTWSLSSGALSCNPNNCGSITSAGVYTSPTVASGLPASVTATATSQADSTKTANATIMLTPATIPGSYPLTVTATETTTNVTSSGFNLNVQ